MKISYHSIGCKVNFAEISEIQKQFESLGNATVAFGEPADAVIINTCSVTNAADSDCRKAIRRAIRNSPDAFIAVVGCYAQLKTGEAAQIEGVDLIAGMKDKFRLPELIGDMHKRASVAIFVASNDEIPFHTACSEDNESRSRMVLKIQDGCEYRCTYCTIPMARGAMTSMPFDELTSKLGELQDSHYYEIVLSGINLGEYSSPEGKSFTDLLKYINSAGLKQRFRISSIEPNLVTDEILDIAASGPAVCPHFHIPLQSGSPDILKAMKRRYSRDYFEELIYKIKTKIPGCAIGIDVISGFPGETEIHFRETFDFLEKLPVSYLHPFTYSERDNTPAAAFPGKVPNDIRKSRTILLRELSEKKKAAFYASQVGSIGTIIPEAYDNNNKNCRGWTGNYVRVELPFQTDPGHEPLKVRLADLQGDIVRGEHLS